MRANQLRCYRFATEAQWNACLFVSADRDPRRSKGGVAPFAPYARPASLYESSGAHAPVVTRTGEILWFDDGCELHRLAPCNDAPETSEAPVALGRASRIVFTADGLWVLAGYPPNSIQLYEEDSLTRLLSIDVLSSRLVDIASDGPHSILALIECKGELMSIRYDSAGHELGTVTFKGLSDAKAFVFLQRSKRYVVLTGGHRPRLFWFSANGKAIFNRLISGVRPCFEAEVLGSVSKDRVFLAGQDGSEFGGGSYIVIFDGDGDSLGEVPVNQLDAPVTGITATRDALLATGQRGLLRFGVAEIVPEGAGEASTTIVTPVLFSQDREDGRRWLRVEATASLPEGSSLEISYASTDVDADRDRLNAIAADESIPMSHRAERLLNEPDLWSGRTVFRGSGDGSQEPKTFSAKLFDVRDRYLWVSISATAAVGGRLPLLSKLEVLYPGRTLMENLPAIYQREESRPDSFLRALVGVLETTTQGLDQRIGTMGSRVNPLTAPEPWLDFIARWLGVPWDDALILEQKQRIVRRSADLAKGRGTRAGLETLLDTLIPGSPRRFRVTDATADLGFAVVGGRSCSGSALPAMLGGHTRWHRELDSTAVLGYMRLPCANQLDDGVWQLAGKVRIEIAATAAERKAWEPWLLALITEMVPLTARIELRWVTARALRTNRLDGTMTLEATPTPHLGTDAITSLARLPERKLRLSGTGPIEGTRLG